MRMTLSTLALLSFLAAAPVQAQIYQATLQEPGQATAEVSTDELKLIIETGSAVVFDARPVEEYSISHIPGALNVGPKAGQSISLYTLEVAEIGNIVNNDLNRPIVLYCNGPFCGKSKRVAADLLKAGYKNVRRYQLGIPVWRALIGVSQIETSAVVRFHRWDRTAWFIDARPNADFKRGSIRGARNVAAGAVGVAKDDGRVPMEDHNTRIIVFGADTAQARTVATELAKNAFQNVTFWAGTATDLIDLFNRDPIGKKERTEQ